MGGQRRLRIPLQARLAAWAALVALAGIAITLVVLHWAPGRPWLAAAIAAGCASLLAWTAMRVETQPVLAMLSALGSSVLSFRDGDYSFSLRWRRDDEIGDLVQSHNAMGEVLRDQRLGLIQRELLLDTMVQNTPVAMLLAQEDDETIVYSNASARQLLHDGRPMEGMTLEQVVRRAFAPLRDALARGGDGLFTVQYARGSDAEDEIFHLSRQQFSLNGRRHVLLLLRQLTAEMRRQEVQTWKKVIRVISHELNNALAPVASLANSGGELVRRGQTERLPEILRTIGERAEHLERFIAGYATFAKLPSPRMEPVAWAEFVRGLELQSAFRVAGTLPAEPARFDRSQMEHALLNLLKNAHESGSKPEDVTLSVRRGSDMVVLEVADRGAGMSAAVFENALVPFYSTKRSGTGLGLALAREIAEAHGGRIGLNNRPGGGVAVTLYLPA